VKALSLTQPWATLIAIGAKRFETRSWNTTYRGRIAIHATKTMPRAARHFAYGDPAGRVLNEAGILLGADCRDLPKGAIIAVATLAGVARTEEITAMSQGLQPHEIEFGDYRAGRFAWALHDIVALPGPLPCQGMLGLWTVPAIVERRLPVSERRRA
jgi:hypothetical protein